MNKYFIGYANQLLDLANTGGFPPFNIRKLEGTGHAIDLAVAGYPMEDLDIEYSKGLLTVKAAKLPNDSTFIHKGISSKGFTRTFSLADNVVIEGAEYKNGILTVELETVIPESSQTKKVPIR